MGAVGSRPGCDIEWVEPRSAAFERCFLADLEQRRLAAVSDALRPLEANLSWSAKESALKALRIGLDLDTRKVVVDSSSDGRFTVSLPVEASPLHGRWGMHAGFVWTAASPRPGWIPAAPEGGDVGSTATGRPTQCAVPGATSPARV